MSFDYDPYAVMTIVKREDGTFSFRCDSCGGGWREAFAADTSIALVRLAFDLHVEDSHRLSREDTKTWHQGF